MAASIVIHDLDEDHLAGDTSTGRLDREYDRKFVAWCYGTTSELAALTTVHIAMAYGCPRRFDPYGPADLGSRCVQLKIDKVTGSGGSQWEIAAHYSTKFGNEDPDETEENPLLRPAKWRYSSQRATRTQERDAAGNVYENAAGKPFESPPVLNYATARYTITRNEATFNSLAAQNYANHVSSATWYGFAVGTVLCESIDAEEMREGEYHYYAVTYVVDVDTKYGWQPVEVANKGYQYYHGGEFLETPTGHLEWLNSAGDLWVAGVDSEDEKFIDRYPYFTANLNDLSL